MSKKVLTFYLCDNLYGIDITIVKEIIRKIECTKVAGSKPYIVGLLNLRGQIVTIFDLAALLGYKEGLINKEKLPCIVLKAKANDPNQVGFLIERFKDVIDIDEKYCEAPPANIGGIKKDAIEAIGKLKEEVLFIIDAKKILEERGELDEVV